MAWTIIATDNFTVGSDTNLEAYSPWTRRAGNNTANELVVKTASNRVQVTAGGQYGFYRMETAAVTSADHEARATVSTTVGDYFGVAVRMTTGGVAYVARVRRTASGNATSYLTIAHYNGGATFTELATSNPTVYNTVDAIRLRAVTTGADEVTLTAQFGAGAEIQAVHNSGVARLLNQGNVGIGARDDGSSTTPYLDNFEALQDVAVSTESDLRTMPRGMRRGIRRGFVSMMTKVNGLYLPTRLVIPAHAGV